MRSRGSPSELEHRRWLAIRRITEGYSPQEVAEFLSVDVSSVRRWLQHFRQQGEKGLRARLAPGRPSKLERHQEKIIYRWLQDSPTDFGFSTDLWTAPRLGHLIEQEFGVHFNRKYLSAWLRARNYTPQIPKRVYREADPEVIAQWLENDWPRIKKKRMK
jgi:transposase